jgi:hypothetical protein
VEALAIGETQEIIEEIYSEQNLVMLKGISNTSTRNNTLLKDKIERLESRGIRGTVKLLRELTWRQSNRSKKADIVNCYYRWQVF